jgi:hypothetical protein
MKNVTPALPIAFASLRDIDKTSRNENRRSRAGALADGETRRRVRWTRFEDFIVDTVLGIHTSSVLALDAASKKLLEIPAEQLVILPGEDRRARLEQVKDYCDRILLGGERVGGFEVAYLMELLELRRDDVACCIGMDATTFDALVDEDDAFDAEDSPRLGLYFLDAWSAKRGIARVIC